MFVERIQASRTRNFSLIGRSVFLFKNEYSLSRCLFLSAVCSWINFGKEVSSRTIAPNIHLEVFFRPVNGEYRHCFFNLRPPEVNF